MEEAILLHTAQQGGPTGPGTGISRQVPPPQPAEVIPGMSTLGINPVSTSNQFQGFGQRFEQGFGSGGMGQMGGMGQLGGMGQMAGMGQMGGAGLQQGGGFGDLGMRPFNPLAPQGTGQMGPMGFGMGGGQFPPGFPQAAGPSAIDPVTGQRIPLGGPGGGADGRRQTSITHAHAQGGVPHTHNGISGDSIPPSSSTGVRLPPSNLALDIPSPAASAAGDPAGQLATTGQTSNILEDGTGMFYVFFPRAESIGVRVNITKEGYCRRNAPVREQNLCMNSCFSDNQCPMELKCCPVGCSLGCLRPNFPGRSSA